jgi:hypothetical protein
LIEFSEKRQLSEYFQTERKLKPNVMDFWILVSKFRRTFVQTARDFASLFFEHVLSELDIEPIKTDPKAVDLVFLPLSFLKKCVEKGFLLKNLTQNGHNCVTLAASEVNSEEIIEYLMEIGLDPDSQGPPEHGNLAIPAGMT